MEPGQKKIFRPIKRALLDILIITDLAIIIFGPTGRRFEHLIIVMLMINVIEAGLWFVIARAYFRIELTTEKISGPAAIIGRVTLKRSELDRSRSEKRSPAARWVGFRDIYSTDGRCIRVYRRILGRRQIHNIFESLGWAPPAQRGPFTLYPSYPR